MPVWTLLGRFLGRFLLGAGWIFVVLLLLFGFEPTEKSRRWIGLAVIVVLIAVILVIRLRI